MIDLVTSQELTKEEIKKYLKFRNKTFNPKTNSDNGKSNFINFFLEHAVLNKQITSLKSPILVSWDITNRCNSKCRTCYYSEFNTGAKDLSLQNLKKISTKLSKAEVLEISLGGGEPLIRPDFKELLADIKNYNFFTNILTNGTLLNGIRAAQIYDLLDENDLIQISLDGGTPLTYYKQRGINKFNDVIKNISETVKAGVPTRCNCVATSINLSEIPKIYEICGNMGVNSFAISMPAFLGNFNNTLFVNQREIIKKLLTVIDIQKEFGYKTKIIDAIGLPYSLKEIRDKIDSDTNKSNLRCLAGTGKMAISNGGNVYPCTFCMFPEFNAGNILKKDLEKIWQSKKFNKFRGERDLSNTKCNKCKYIGLCRGGCPGIARSIYKSINNPDPRCNWC